jgi:hypothetical protein
MKERLIKLMDAIFWPTAFIALFVLLAVILPFFTDKFSLQANTNNLLSVILQQNPDDPSNQVCISTTGGGDGGCNAIDNNGNPCPAYDPNNIGCLNVPGECFCCSCPCIRPFIIGGNGKLGYSGDRALAINAQLNLPTSVAYDPFSKSTYIADSQNFTIRKIDASGVITTLTGSPQGSSFTNPNGSLSQASLGKVKALAFNSVTRELYLASEPNIIAKISLTRAMITTISGNGSAYASPGVPALDAFLGQPQALAVDSKGNLYVAATNKLGGGKIYQINPTGQIVAIFGLDSTAPKPGELNGDQGQASQARFGLITDIALDSVGNIYLADASQQLIRKIQSTTSIVTTFLGGGRQKLTNGVLAQNSQLTEQPRSIIVNKSGELYFSTKSTIYRVDSVRVVRLAAGAGLPYPPDNNPSTKESLLQVGQMDIDLAGKLYFTDVLAGQVLTLDSSATTSNSAQLPTQKPITKQTKSKGNNGLPTALVDPLPPSDLGANVDGSTVNLSWTDNAQGQFGFVVERDTNNSGTYVQIATVPANQTTYTDNASPNTEYCYQIRLNIPKIDFVKLEELDGTALEDSPNPLGNEITVNGKKYGGGVRVFPDATSSDPFSPDSSPKRNLIVKVRVNPVQENLIVYFRSFDVDDSSGLFNNPNNNGQDNQEANVRLNGFPKEGFFTGVTDGEPASAMTNSIGIATFEFNVSMQPGDNFKIVATTNPDLVATNPSNPRLIVSGQQILNTTNINMPPVSLPQQPDTGQPAIASAEAMTSQLLTVWRRLHVEVDSMDAPSTSSTDANNNFSSGDIKTITSKGNDIELGLYESNTTNLTRPLDLTLPNRIQDLSPNLSGMNNPTLNNPGLGNGRFENGTITIGNATQSVIITPLIGNGINFVRFQETNTNRIPFTLVNGSNTLTGTIKELDFINREFTLSRSVGGTNYNGGTLTIAGITFNVTNAKGPKITVMEQPSLPLIKLVDDDTATTPFLTGASDAAFDLMQNTDVPTNNLFARAYVKPIYDLPGQQNNLFIRNYQTPAQITTQLDLNQSTKGAPNYWVVYIQGAFQGSSFVRTRDNTNQITKEIGDGDPLSEVLSTGTGNNAITRGAVLAETAKQGIAGSERSLGTVLFMETIADQARNSGFDCKTITTVHEVGHQFDLIHKDPDNLNLLENDIRLGIMSALCGQMTVQEFIRSHIKLIRNSERPQRRNN